MKEFNDFLKTLTDTDYENIKNEILTNRELCSITYAIPEISYKMTLKLLEKYHMWLNN